GFRVFAEALAAGNPIRGLAVPGGGAALSRREVDDLVGFATAEGAGGLTWIKIGADGWQSPAVKFLSDAERERLTAAGRLEAGDLLVLLAEPEARAGSGSIARTCSSACSRSSAGRRARRTRASASCWRRSPSARRRTAGSPSASTAWSCCWRAPTRSAR